VRTDIVEASEFPDLARRFNVYTVPKTVINDTQEVVGAVPESNFVEAITAALTPPEPS
jgi:predicted DsbA family dithiol-disulfide isomerase